MSRMSFVRNVASLLQAILLVQRVGYNVFASDAAKYLLRLFLSKYVTSFIIRVRVVLTRLCACHPVLCTSPRTVAAGPARIESATCVCRTCAYWANWMNLSLRIIAGTCTRKLLYVSPDRLVVLSIFFVCSFSWLLYLCSCPPSRSCMKFHLEHTTTPQKRPARLFTGHSSAS